MEKFIKVYKEAYNDENHNDFYKCKVKVKVYPVGAINTKNIVKVYEHPDSEYMNIECREEKAGPYMFIILALLAVFVVGIPWFIAYCLGVKVKSTTYLVKTSDIKDTIIGE